MLPTLRTGRLVLRPATDDDIDTLHAMLVDPQVRRYLCDGEILPRRFVADRLAEAAALAPRCIGWWVIEAQDAPIGMLALLPVSEAALQHVPHLAGEIEPTVALLPQRWGQGYAVEALHEAVRYAFEQLGFTHMVAMTDAPNTASQAMLARAGFFKTGESTGPVWPTWTYRLEAPGA